MRKLLYILVMLAGVLHACGDKNSFEIKGTIDGAANKKMVVQRTDNGVWVNIDSIETDGDGKFAYHGAAPAFPEIYRLEYNGRYAYFPIDSLDHIELKADTANFDTGYTLTGSDNAIWLTEVNRKVQALSGKAADSQDYVKTKRELTERLLKDPSSIVAYYTVEKIVDGHRLFDPSNAADLKIIGAVATGYGTFREGNPLTKYMEAEYMAGMRMQPRNASPSDTIHANQIGYFDIALKDAGGKVRKLSDVAVSGKVVLLNFTTYAAKESPEFNRILADIYKKYSSRGFSIYQVGYDASEFSWKDAAKNLPWTAVFDPAGAQSKNLVNYNVGSLPAIFIIDRNGTIAERVMDLNELEISVARHI